MKAMKKTILAILAFILLSVSARAVPATPKPVKYRQPDGSVIEIRLHGDEFYNYTTCNGRVVSLDAKGFYVPSQKPRFDLEKILARKAENRKAARIGRRSSSDRISFGNKRFLVMLIEFADLQFTVANPNQTFSNLLNQEGYSANGASGSAADYYRQNSNGRFNPTFDVVGPVRVSKGFAAYGAKSEVWEDTDPDGLLREACSLVDAEVNFADYDLDGDGFIDNIFFFFAGHNQAEGAGENYIWPHQGGAYKEGFMLDGKYLNSYACASEYRGANGKSMAGIGTFCHEYGHVLGLPDFYDTDYEENGSSEGVYTLSLMCSGCYNDNGRRPPYFGALERILLGWLNLEMSTSNAQVQLSPIQEDSYMATPTSVEGEYFLYEYRNGEGWDRSVNIRYGEDPIDGLVIYHVDRSSNPVGDYAAADLWNANSLNNYAVHPCYTIERTSGSVGSIKDLVYPGNNNITHYESKDWAGLRTGFVLDNIAEVSGKMSFSFTVPSKRTIKGKIRDSAGNPLQGAKIACLGKSCTSGSDGSYELVLPADSPEGASVDITKEMYRPVQMYARLTAALFELDVTLLSIAEPRPVQLSKHGNPSGGAGFSNEADSYSASLAVCFSPEELNPYYDFPLSKINFIIYGDKATQVDVFVDFDNERKFTRKVGELKDGNTVSVDISDSGLAVPSGKKMYVGIAVKEITTQYWMGIDNTPYVEGGGVMLGEYAVAGSDGWYDSGFNFLIDCELFEKLPVFETMSLRWIPNPNESNGYPVGTILDLKLQGNGGGEQPSSTQWYYDGTRLSGDTLALTTTGKHSLKAVLIYPDGSSEEIEQIILVR